MLLRRDDGVAVYINGQEIYRDGNLIIPDAVDPQHPPHNVAYNEGASVAYNDDGGEFILVEIPAAALALQETGNTIAVELHQIASSHSDLSFDLELATSPYLFGVQANDYDVETARGTMEAVLVPGSPTFTACPGRR